MKKTLLSLATLVTAGLLSMAADCSGTNVESCTVDEDCTDAAQICDTEAGQCVDAQCTENEDCALAGSTSAALCPINKTGATCNEDVAGCGEGAVEVVDSLGTSYCAVEPEDGVFDCAADLTNGAEATVEAAAGGTVTVCVDSDDACTAGQCG